jgi:hypothetical protein
LCKIYYRDKERTIVEGSLPVQATNNFSPLLVVYYSLTASLDSGDNHFQSLRLHKNIYYSKKKERLGGEKMGSAVNAACQENLLACHFGHACHRLVNPDIYTVIFRRSVVCVDENNSHSSYAQHPITNEIGIGCVLLAYLFSLLLNQIFLGIAGARQTVGITSS